MRRIPSVLANTEFQTAHLPQFAEHKQLQVACSTQFPLQGTFRQRLAVLITHRTSRVFLLILLVAILLSAHTLDGFDIETNTTITIV
jgi:hypothetical protein